ncbi:PREDICTED: proteasome activator complex subunit 3-like [Amphimedon queenslandica]|nr:PREDICTED: proteasome activator complex subunit 3-like [Amphimedon queenslandica]|eukprot:XP_003392061.2 PREDICTED: proteasome activator complex subunit 3-like [Amphimedon queenslandica]
MFSLSDPSQIHCELNIPSQLTTPTNNCNGDPSNELGSKKRKLDTDRTVADVYGNLIQQPDGQKVVPSFNEVIGCNPKLETIVDYLKPQIITVIKHCSNIKLWIQLMIPKIEDGNNFGVSIQEDILSEVTKAESDASSYLDQTTRYFSCRAQMLKKLIKYPHLTDFRRAINEYDEKVFFSFQLILTELRNIYVVLYDVIIKNYLKLKTPRSTNSSSLY